MRIDNLLHRHHINRLLPCMLFLAGSLLLASCDFLDPTDVENPRTTDEDLANAPNPVKALLPGLRAEFAEALSATVNDVEFGSDNYSINGTGFGGNEFDFPRDIIPGTAALNSTGGIGMYWHTQNLRALADFVLNDIAPGDDTATADDIAEAHYYRGMAYLIQGENFIAVPTEVDGAPIPARGLLERAVSDLSQASSGAFAIQTNAALARAHRALGNSTETTQFANAALAAGGNNFVILQEYDEVGSFGNGPYAFLVSRALQEMQPLPRLDFLDPKYIDQDQGIAITKAEEMLLLLAEAALSNSDVDGARQRLNDVLNVVATRPTAPFSDNDARLDNDLNIRPRNAEITIRADASSPFQAGLVLTRPGPVNTPTISGTSVTADDLNAATDVGSMTRLLYLMRQEVLFLEGRRMHDLGIRLPMMLREIETNPNINDGDTGTQVFVPSWIPAANEMELYTPLLGLYDANEQLTTTEVTMLHDMNKILAQQRGLVISNTGL